MVIKLASVKLPQFSYFWLFFPYKMRKTYLPVKSLHAAEGLQGRMLYVVLDAYDSTHSGQY